MSKNQTNKEKEKKLVLSEPQIRSIKRLTLISALLVPLASSLILFPALEIIKANSSTTILYEILYRISEGVTQAAVFTIAALLCISIYYSDYTLFSGIISKALIGFIIFAVALRAFMFWLLAYADSFLAIGFNLSDYLLTTLIDENYLWWAALSYFMNILIILLLLSLSAGISFGARAHAKKKYALNAAALSNLDGSHNPTFPVTLYTVVSFLLISLVSQIDNTVNTIRDYGSPTEASEIVYIFSGYIYILIYSTVGFITMSYIFKYILSKPNNKTE